MIFKSEFTPAAAKQYEAIVYWYFKRSEIASHNFIIKFEEKLKRIKTNPNLYRNTYKNFREAHLEAYPYIIIFGVDPENRVVYIAGIYHKSRNPKKKFKNL